MKNRLTKSSLLLVLCTMAFLFVSCNNKEAQLKKEIETANKDCPLRAA